MTRRRRKKRRRQPVKRIHPAPPDSNKSSSVSHVDPPVDPPKSPPPVSFNSNAPDGMADQLKLDIETARIYFVKARDEAIQRLTHREQGLFAFMAAIAGITGYVIAHPIWFPTLFLIPFLSLGTALLLLQHDLVTGILSRYQRKELQPLLDQKVMLWESSDSLTTLGKLVLDFRLWAHRALLVAPGVLSLAAVRFFDPQSPLETVVATEKRTISNRPPALIPKELLKIGHNDAAGNQSSAQSTHDLWKTRFLMLAVPWFAGSGSIFFCSVLITGIYRFRQNFLDDEPIPRTKSLFHFAVSGLTSDIYWHAGLALGLVFAWFSYNFSDGMAITN